MKFTRLLLPAAAALLLAGCFGGGGGRHRPGSVPQQPQTPAQPGGAAVPSGRPQAAGTVHAPAGSGASYRAVSFAELPQWGSQPFAGSLKSFRQSCTKLAARPQWSAVCTQAQRTGASDAEARQFFERYFTAWQVSGNGRLDGTVTGYYEPVLNGDTRMNGRARYPIYGLPADLVSVPLPASLRGSKAVVRVRATGSGSGQISPSGSHTANLADFPITERSSSLKGRFEGGRFVPYYTRAQINSGAINDRAPVLAYADDPIELFFMHIQGSGRLRTPDGRFVRLGFADKNEHRYGSIGRYMADKGYLPLGQTSMQGIKRWMAANPGKLSEVLAQNPSYVFFRQLPGDDSGPLGALGVPLSGGFSGAVDKRYITLGAPLFVATVHPETRRGLNRLIVAQDTGSAIKGAVRVDFFWGYGDNAGQSAGKMKDKGYVWMLLPNGMLPEYRP